MVNRQPLMKITSCLTAIKPLSTLRFLLIPVTSGNSIYQVEDTKGEMFVVNLSDHGAAEHDIACSHMLAVIQSTGRQAEDWISQEYTIDTYRETYKEPLYPLRIKSPATVPDIQTPVVKSRKRRPKEKGFIRGEYGARMQTCGNCKQRARHNARSCTNRPAEEPLFPTAEELAAPADEAEQLELQLEQMVWDMDHRREMEELAEFYRNNHRDSYVTMSPLSSRAVAALPQIPGHQTKSKNQRIRRQSGFHLLRLVIVRSLRWPQEEEDMTTWLRRTQGPDFERRRLWNARPEPDQGEWEEFECHFGLSAG